MEDSTVDDNLTNISDKVDKVLVHKNRNKKKKKKLKKKIKKSKQK